MKIVLLILFFFLFTSLAGFYFAIRPNRFISAITPAYYQIPFEQVTLTTVDKVKLSAWFIRSARPSTKAIILLHGYPADKGDILPSRIFLHEHYNLLFLDFRYFGGSEGKYSAVGAKETLDVKAAIDYLHSQGITAIGIWGFSLGGAVAIMSADTSPDIKAIVAESSYANLYDMVFEYYRIPLLKYPLGELTRLWGIIFLGTDIKKISPASVAANTRIPILILHSRQDDVIAFQHALILEKAVQKNPHAQVKFTDNLRHGQSDENYQHMVADFFHQYLNSNQR